MTNIDILNANTKSRKAYTYLIEKVNTLINRTFEERFTLQVKLHQRSERERKRFKSMLIKSR